MPASGYSFIDDYKTLLPVGWFTVLFLGGYYLKKEKRIQALSHQTNANNLPLYTLNEVAQHTSKQSRIWVTYKDGVYDITDFVGGEIILTAAGSAVDPFWMIHGVHKQQEILELLETYRIDNMSGQAAGADDPFVDEPTGRNPLLIVWIAKPFNAEPPLPILIKSFITPGDLLYVRNHNPVPCIDVDAYELTISAPNKPDVRLSLNDLKNKFPKTDVISVMQCAGHRRQEMTKVKPVKAGVLYGVGAIGNVIWSGARLIDVIKYIGYDSLPNINHVQFEGFDNDATNAPFGGSIPVEKAFNPKKDVIIAYGMNGHHLLPDHGYPVRMVVPGHVGVRNIKWLKRIVLSNEESPSQFQRKHYKGLSPSQDPEKVDISRVPPIQELPITSGICLPSENDKVKLKNGKITVEGYAYSGGGRRIVRVDVTADGGNSWTTADSVKRDGSEAGRCWSWVLWKAEVPVPAGVNMVELWAKAVDSSGNTQPESFEMIWNVNGVLGNAYHRVKVFVEH